MSGISSSAADGTRRGARALALALTLLLLLPASALEAKSRSPRSEAGGGTLILYDTSGQWGWLGEQYALAGINLAGHFGSWSAKPVTDYTPGEMGAYKAVIYIGSTYNEPLPKSFLDDTLAGEAKVVWLGWNIWQLSKRAGRGRFKAKYGWRDGRLNNADVRTVTYKGQRFTRTADAGPLVDYQHVDTDKANVKAHAETSNGNTFPWAIASGNLTYVGEIPFAYMKETDRYLIFSDLLFDVLAPNTPERHRAMVRLEDIGCDSDPEELKRIADYLSGAGVPFSFGVFPVYRDPQGLDNGGTNTTIKLSEPRCRDVRDALEYMIDRGGTMIMHGYTHQCDCSMANPYNGRSGDDFEFFTAHVDGNNYVRYDGPVPGDSFRWAAERIEKGLEEFKKAVLLEPSIFEAPHYAASAEDYRAIGSLFSARYERSMYFNGLLDASPGNDSRFMGQFFPYVVKDVYGTKVLPENIGNIEPEAYNHHPVTMPVDLINRARLNLAVRDGFASFFYHPYLGVGLLKQTVEGIKDLGYRFVAPTSL